MTKTTTIWIRCSTMALLAGMAVSASAQERTYKPGDTPAQTPVQPAQPADPAMTYQPSATLRPITLVPSEWAIGRNVYGLNDEKIGDINDLIISRPDGRIAYALIGQGGVLGIGEKVIAVPYSMFAWNPQKKAHALPLNAERLKGAPALEPGDWKTLNESSRFEATYAYFGVPREAAKEAGDSLYRETYRSTLKSDDMPLLRVSELKGKKLMASDGRELGKVEEIVYDAGSGRAAFVVVTFGGVMGLGEDKVAVPWTAFDVNKEGHLYATKLDKEVVQSAPRLKERDWAELRETGYAPRVYKHYGLKAPWFDRAAAAAPSGASPAMDEYNRLYSTGTEKLISGTVVSVDDSSPKAGLGNLTCVTVRTSGNDTTLVHIAPRSYLDQSGVTLKPGDTVTIRGRMVKDEGRNYLIANEITSGSGKPLTVRNADGTCPWSWR